MSSKKIKKSRKNKTQKNIYNKKENIILILVVIIIATIGISYAVRTSLIGLNNSVFISGDIHMHYDGEDTIKLTNLVPMTKEEGLSSHNNSFNFTITGKNTSSEDIYYGISMIEGEVPDGKTNIKASDIMVYLASEDNILVDGVRYQNFSNNIYVDKINAGTTSKISRNYSLKVWLRDGIIVSDTESYASYTTSEWANLYMSLKVKVNANMNSMNMPLMIEHDSASVVNNQQYFIATIKNYFNPEEAGEMLETSDNVVLEVTSNSDNIEFTYKDSLTTETIPSDSLTIEYIFDKKQSEEVQIFVTPKNNLDTSTEVAVKLTINDTEMYNQIIPLDIKGTNYCLDNGFTNFFDCLLVAESQAESVEVAKKQILNKGELSLSQTAPVYKYVQKVDYNVENPGVPVASGFQYYIGDGYTEINEDTGNYNLLDWVKKDSLTNDDIGKYTIGTNHSSFTVPQESNKIYKILEIVDGKITKADIITYEITSTIRSEVGLYKTQDDYGDTYIYRGDVKNNNVYFAGYYWKIVRINGDESIRMIYAGSSPENEGFGDGINAIGVGFNTGAYAPTYVGYMYGGNLEKTIGTEARYTHIAANTKYYFADDYTTGSSANTFKLSGNITSVPYTFKEMNTLGTSGFTKYPYTCKLESATSDCDFVLNVTKYVSETSVNAKAITYGSRDLSHAKANDTSSNAKKLLDEWYQQNIVSKKDEKGNLITNYIVDGSFCNDRRFSDTNTGDGFSLNPSTSYYASSKLTSSTIEGVNLTCDNIDKFSTTTAYGNAKLTYPVGLLTAEEAVLAGASLDEKNLNFYLRTGVNFWTMTPVGYITSVLHSRVFLIEDEGELKNNYRVSSIYSLRPVINISPNVLLSKGDGTNENPFEFTLN